MIPQRLGTGQPHASVRISIMEYVARLNIERYQKLLKDEADDKKRAVLQALLDKEVTNLAQLSGNI